MHLEINAWQHMLDLMYKEAVRSGLSETFVQTIKNPICDNGCGLNFIGRSIEEHYSMEKTRFNKLSTRLIGEQAIKLARYSYRLIDVLFTNASVSGAQKVKMLAISNISILLRDIGSMLSRVHVQSNYPDDIFQSFLSVFQ